MEVDFVDADEFAAIEMALQQAAARKAASAATNQQQSGPLFNSVGDSDTII